MRSFPLTVSSPDGHIFQGEAVMLTLRGTEGNLAIMAGHVPFVTSVVACTCKIELADEEMSDRTAHTDGGLLTVSADGSVTLLSGSFRWTEAE